jgi:ELWxxDGT repeat protein
LSLSLILVELAGAQSDGGPAFRVADLPGREYSGLPSPVDVVTAAGGVAYFITNDCLHGHELWRSDGTAAGTRPVGDIRPGQLAGVFDLFATGSDVLFTSQESLCSDMRLWRSDGSDSGTVPGPLLPGYDRCHFGGPWPIPTLKGGVAGDLL